MGRIWDKKWHKPVWMSVKTKISNIKSCPIDMYIFWHGKPYILNMKFPGLIFTESMCIKVLVPYSLWHVSNMGQHELIWDKALINYQ